MNIRKYLRTDIIPHSHMGDRMEFSANLAHEINGMINKMSSKPI